MKSRKLEAITFNRRQLEFLRRIFPNRGWDRGTDLCDLAYVAGTQEVLRVVERNIPDNK